MTTLAEIGNINGSSSAISRWATFGPYYAMFPIDFAFEIVNKYSKKGDHIIDPFAGRFSAVYAGAILGRNSVGIEINPVGWLYGNAKLSPAKKEDVLARLAEIYSVSSDYREMAADLSEFFQLCYSEKVLTFLVAAKENLDWRKNKIDASLMSLILVNLHGKKGEGLSNQMRQTKAMAPAYSVEWWKKNGYSTPPDYDPVKFLTEKIEWRYKKGIPRITTTYKAILGESTQRLNPIVREAKQKNLEYSLLFTSPPYHAVVDYHADQWIRLWLLNEKKSSDKYKRRFNSKPEYANLMNNVFEKCAKLMSKRSTIFVRTDIRKFTLETTIEVLRRHFPKHKLKQEENSVSGISQTELFNNVSKRKEVDLILTS